MMLKMRVGLWIFIFVCCCLELQLTKSLNVSPCPYPVEAGRHCSRMCSAFKIGEPVTKNPSGHSCFTFGVYQSYTDNSYLEIKLVLEPDCTPITTFSFQVIEAVIQAFDTDGYPIGIWEVGVGQVGLDLHKQHCNLNPGDKSDFFYGHALQTNVPVLSIEDCDQTASVKSRLASGSISDPPKYVRLKQNNPKNAAGFNGLGLLWRMTGAASSNRKEVSFIAEINTLLNGKPDGIHTTVTQFQNYYVYNHYPNAPLPLMNCFKFLGLPRTIYTFIEKKDRVGSPSPNGKWLSPSVDYLKEMALIRSDVCEPNSKLHCGDMCNRIHHDLSAAVASKKLVDVQVPYCHYGFRLTPIKNKPNWILVQLVRAHITTASSVREDCSTAYTPNEITIQGFDDGGFPFGSWALQPNPGFLNKLEGFNKLSGQFCQDPNTDPNYCATTTVFGGDFEKQDCTITPSFPTDTRHIAPDEPPSLVRFTRRPTPIHSVCAFWFHNLQLGDKSNSVTFKAEIINKNLAAENAKLGVSAAQIGYVLEVTSKKVKIEPGKLNPPENPPRSLWKCFDEFEFANSGSFELVDDGKKDLDRKINKNNFYLTETLKKMKSDAEGIPVVYPTTQPTPPPPVVPPPPPGPVGPRPPPPPPLGTKPPPIRIPGQPQSPEPNVTPLPSSLKEEKEEEDKFSEIYQNCKITKRCLAGRESDDPRIRHVGLIQSGFECVDDAKAKKCPVLLSYGNAKHRFAAQVSSSELYMELVGKSLYWVALGISTDRKMGKDFVVECVREEGQIKLYPGWNANTFNKDDRNRRIANVTKYRDMMKLLESGFRDGNIFCKFWIKRILIYEDPVESVTYEFNLGQTPYYILIAKGFSFENIVLGESGHLNYHGEMNAFVTDKKAALAARFSPYAYQQYLIFTHGGIMFFVYLFIFPMATFIARYYKETFTKTVFMGYVQWNLIHIILQSIGLFLIFGGHFCLTFANEGWTRVGSDHISVHLWTSLVSTSLYLYNTLLGFVDRSRPIGVGCDGWHWIHGVIGHISYLTGIATLMSSSSVPYSFLPCKINSLLICWVVIYFIFHLVMSYHYCWVDWVYGLSTGRAFTVGPLDLIVQPNSDDNAPGRHIRLALLFLFGLASSIVTIISLVFIGISNDETTCIKIEEFVHLAMHE